MIYQSAPAWSIKSKSSNSNNKGKTSKQDCTPPPDAYNPSTKLTLSKSPTYKLGKQSRDQSKASRTPAPNNYSPPSAQKLNKYGVFGNEKRMKQIISSTPGPGSYTNSLTKQHKSALFTLEPKCVININKFPGPGAYETKIGRVKAGAKIGRQKRFTVENQRNQSPGPANYNCYKSSSPSICFGKQQRIKFQNGKENQVGPGQYHFVDDFSKNVQGKRGFTLGARHTAKLESSSPGPASYSPLHKELAGSPSITISMKYKQKSFDRTPSPDQYHPQYKTIVTKAESFSIGKAQKFISTAFDNSLPGPGTYLKTEYLSTGISVSLGKSRKNEQYQDFPGPGSYNPQKQTVQRRPASAKIGQSKRFQKLNTEASPSPMFYQSKTICFDKPKYSFPKKKKLEHKNRQIPGPGAYNIPSTISNTPSYTRK